MSIGTNIKKRRYELRMSQEELAKALGYKSRSTIAKIESGENDISQRKLQNFAKVLDTSVEALILGSSYSSVEYEKGISRINNVDSYDNKSVAVILAGGKSSRNQQNIPNQFINILGKPVIAYCLEAYQNHPSIDDIYIVCLRGWEHITVALTEQYNITKFRGLISGASSGILSVCNAIDELKNHYKEDDVIVFQEATRPLVSYDMISKLLSNCYEYGSANLCQPMNDYLQFSIDGNNVEYVNRESTVCVQSPEAYRFNVIIDVFKNAEEKKFPLTESCCAMLLHNLGYKTNFIYSDVNNMKIVRQEDVAIATALLKGI